MEVAVLYEQNISDSVCTFIGNEKDLDNKKNNTCIWSNVTVKNIEIEHEK
jgi:hypothetical protein